MEVLSCPEWLVSLFMGYCAAAIPLSLTIAAKIREWSCLKMSSWRRQKHPDGERYGVTHFVAGGVMLAAFAVCFAIVPVRLYRVEYILAAVIAETLLFSVADALLGFKWSLAPTRYWWCGCFCFAAIVPACYQQQLLTKQVALADEYWSQGSVTKCLEVAEPLRTWTPERTIAGQPLEKRVKQAEELAERFQTATATALPAGAPEIERVRYARMLAALDQLEMAESTLTAGPLTMEGRFLLGALYQRTGKFAASNTQYDAGLSFLEKQHPNFIGHYVRAVNAIAFNYRELKQYSQAEESYLQAMQTAPETSELLRLQLGRHYVLAGRYRDAFAHLSMAARSWDPQIASEAAEALNELRLHTPACVFPSPQEINQR